MLEGLPPSAPATTAEWAGMRRGKTPGEYSSKATRSGIAAGRVDRGTVDSLDCRSCG